jgi:ferric-chelate reductase
MFDRVGRGVRLFFNRGTPKPYEAIVEAISHDSVRVTLPNRHMTWKAGQHAFLTLPGVSRFPFECHPFTIANIPDRDSNGKKKATDLVFYIRAMRGFTRKLQDYAAAHQGGTVSAFVDGPYGIPPPVTTFSTVVLIAGTYALSLLFSCSS